MYNMAEAGVAKQLDNPIMYDKHGNKTIFDDKVSGLKTYYGMLKPDNILLVDKTGCNTNQKAYGAVGREKLVVPTHGSCNCLSGSVSDQHYTTLVFQTASGQPVCCCRIMKFSSLLDNMPAIWVTKIDYTQADQLSGNLNDKHFAKKTSNLCNGGPICEFQC